MHSGSKPPSAKRERSKMSPSAAADSEFARRVHRREALKGLGAFAVTLPALAAVGCSSDGASAAPVGTGGQSGTTTSGAAGAMTGPAGSNAVGTAGASVAGRSGAHGAAGSTAGSSASAGAGGSATAGSAGSAQAGMSGGPMTSTGGMGGAPAAGSGGTAATGNTTLDMLACVVTPAMEDGPFFVEEKMLNRSNLIEGETDAAVAMATPFKLIMGIYKVDGMMCMPLSNVQVDIWHANAIGVYSDVASGAVQSVDTRGKKYLRGWQDTDAQGMVTFQTIYPGWYMSRTIHIHFKLRMPGTNSPSMSFTSQMYFDEAINSMVLSKGVYTMRTGTRSVTNDKDHIYNGQPVGSMAPPTNGMAPGAQIMPKLVAMGDSFEGTLKIGVKML